MGSTEHLISSLGEEAINERLNAFFPGVLDSIGLTDEQVSDHCEVRVRELPIHGSQEGESLIASNDRVTELWVGERAIATIIELRDDFNFANVLLADYLSPELIAQLHEILDGTGSS
jgi:hypothetical protein